MFHVKHRDARPSLGRRSLNEYAVVVSRPAGESGRLQLTRARGHVIASADGGVTWTDLGRQDLGAEIRDLALGIDGANLYAATGAGVYRLELSRAASE